MTSAAVDAFLDSEEGRALSAFAETSVSALRYAGLIEDHDLPMARAVIVSGILRRECSLGTALGTAWTEAAKADREAEDAALAELLAEPAEPVAA